MQGYAYNAMFQTLTGREVDLFNPHKTYFNISDIAFSLAKICRYNGHTNRFYSVLEHSLHVSYLVPKRYALQALLHEVAEPYVGDIIRPLKNYVLFNVGPEIYITLNQLENRIIVAAFRSLSVPIYRGDNPLPPEVEQMDEHICAFEIKEFLPGWPLPSQVHPYIDLNGAVYSNLPMDKMAEFFIDRYDELRWGNGRGGQS